MVKVKFPWVSDDLESNWARVVGLGAGGETPRGLYWLPEINDEVLVAFEHGDFNRPYILGGVWNGKFPPPAASAAANGVVNLRALQTRVGHTIRFDDTDGAEKIEIFDKEVKRAITFDTANDKFTIVTASGTVEITADTDIKVTSNSGSMTVEAASGDITMKATNITLDASGTLTLKGASSAGKLELASAGATLQGANGQSKLELAASGGTLQATAPLTLKGAIVNIN